MHVTTGGSYNHMHPETDPVGIRTRSVKSGAGDAALPGVDYMKRAATNLPASVRQRLLNLANENGQVIGMLHAGTVPLAGQRIQSGLDDRSLA